MQVKYICDLNSDVSLVFKLNLVRTQTKLFCFYFVYLQKSQYIFHQLQHWKLLNKCNLHEYLLTYTQRAYTYHNHMSDLMCNASSCLLSRL